jgi:hypothetical protein
VYADNRYEPDELIWRIEELLGEGSASAVR